MVFGTDMHQFVLIVINCYISLELNVDLFPSLVSCYTMYIFCPKSPFGGPTLLGHGSTLLGHGSTLLGHGSTLLGHGPTLTSPRESWAEMTPFQNHLLLLQVGLHSESAGIDMYVMICISHNHKKLYIIKVFLRNAEKRLKRVASKQLAMPDASDREPEAETE
jgi:hypothetical protein